MIKISHGLTPFIIGMNITRYFPSLSQNLSHLHCLFSFWVHSPLYSESLMLCCDGMKDSFVKQKLSDSLTETETRLYDRNSMKLSFK